MYFNFLFLCVMVMTANGNGHEGKTKLNFPPPDLHDFKELLMQSDIYVDKTMLIEKLIGMNGKLPIVINQPKGWGKSTNLNMLRSFFEIEVNEQGAELPDSQKINKKFFLGGQVSVGNRKKSLHRLKIAERTDLVEKYHGKFPVLYFSFKDLFDPDYAKTKARVAARVMDLYTMQYPYLEKYCSSADTQIPNKAEIKQYFDNKIYPNVNLDKAFHSLGVLLKEHFKRRVVVLIDDYDELIQHALQTHADTISQAPYIDLVGKMMGSVLEGVNIDVVERSCMTGIFPFNDFQLSLTGLEHFTLLDAEFSNYYGFDEHEVKQLWKMAAVETKLEDIKAWYNGFHYGQVSLYNPISVLRCLQNGGKLEHYSIRNQTFLDFLGTNITSLKFHRGLQRFCCNKTRYYFHIVSGGIPYPSDLYYFLLFGGYTRVRKYNSTEERDYDLSTPNFEAIYMYEKFILKLITQKFHLPRDWQTPLAALLGDYKIEEFRTALQRVLATTDALNRVNTTGVRGRIADITTYPSDGRFYNGLLLSIAYSLPPYFIQIGDMGEEYFDRIELLLIPSVTSNRKEAIVIKFREMWVVDKYLSTEEHSESKEKFGELKEDSSMGLDDFEVNLPQQAEFRVKSMEILKHFAILKAYPYVEHIHKLYAVFRGNEVAIGHRKVPNERTSFTPRFRSTRPTTITTIHESIDTDELSW